MRHLVSVSNTTPALVLEFSIIHKSSQACSSHFLLLQVMLRMWGEELNARDEEVKTSMKGKQDANRYTQTRYKEI